MITLAEKKVTVEKKALLAALRENLKKHQDQYIMAMTSFRTALKLELQKLAELAEGGNFNSPPKLEATAPISHSKDYSDIILMLEMSVDESLELDIGSFKQYVLDEWSWKEYNSTSILSNSSVITKYS